MSLIFGCAVKAATGVIARERAGVAADSQQRPPRRRALGAGLCALLIAAAALVTSPARGQSITATVTDNNQPRGIAINPVTNKIYFADAGSGTLTVVDGATNAVSTVSGGNSSWAVVVNPATNMVYTVDRGLNKVDVFTGATATAPAQFVTAITTGGSNLYAIAINPVTNMVYVCDDGDFRVFVINGNTNTVTTTVALGGINAPDSVAVNPATNMIYVADSVSNNVSVINGSNNTLLTTVGVGSTPYSLAVNPATNKIYVANSGSNNVSVIDGSTNTVTATLQDPNASSPVAVAVNPETNQIYIGNSGSSNTTIINGANNAVTDVGTNAGTSTFTSVAVDTSTNQAYVANSGNGTVTIINGNTFAVTTQLTAQAQTGQIAVNPVTHKAYAADFTSGGQVPITVIDGATNTVQQLTPPNQAPAAVAVNPVTNLIYVANSASNNVSVINGSTNTLQTTVATDANPAAIVVDPVNNLVYVANSGGGDITVIDSQFSTSTITFSQAISPNELAFNPVLNMVYGATSQASGLAFQFYSADGDQYIYPNTLVVGTDITAVAVNPAQGYNVYVVATVPGAMVPTPGIQVFDSHGGFTTSTCDAPAIPDAMDVNATTNTIYVACSDGTIDIYQQPDSFNAGNLLTLVPTPGRGAAVAVNAVTNTAYVADSGSSNVYVITGASPAIVTIPVVSPVAIAVNVATNKIYVVSQGNTPNVTIIDGATNTILGTIPLTGPGSLTEEIAVNPATGNIYALDSEANAIDVITENAVRSNALQTTINPLPSISGLPPNSTNTTAPTFTFSATNHLSFSTPTVNAPVTGVYFQVDTQQGQWTAATYSSVSGGVYSFTGAASGITPGFHILYAYATDGEDGAAGNSGAYSAQNGPLVGAITYYGFLVSPPIATINFYPLDFGNIPVGGMSPSPYPILINEGGSSMTYSYTITGPNASEFIVNPGQSSCVPSGTLSANSSCVIYVTFQPTTTGLATATLTWTDDSLGISNSTQSIGFTANGVKATTFSNLTLSQSIPAGTNSINLSGTISAVGSFPPNGETVAITINSATQNATIGTNGVFATAFNTSAIPSSATPYTITYSYPGDANFASAMDSSTTLTVNPLNSSITDTVTLLGTGTGFVIDGQNLNCSETAGMTSGTCSGNYTANSMVVFTANPTAPTTFGGWGGACASSGTNPTCHLTIISSQNITANFIPPPTTVALTFPAGTNPPPQEAVFACPSNTNPCTDPSAHALQLTIPNVSATVAVTVLATEVPPSQADGLCESGNSVTNDFDCRFVTFFSDGTDVNNNTIVPLCDPYANGNCVHYLVYSTAGGPGVEPPASSYSGGVYWQITWNNESFTPPAPNYLGSTPQLYDDPDYPVSQTTPYGTNCSPSTPMLVGISNPQDTNPLIYCQFEFNITQFYNPTQTVDSGIGGSTKQFNDVVVAFPPTVAGTNPVVQPPTPSTPAIAVTCLTGCSITGTTINFTVGTGGTFQAVPTGYPAPTLTESGTLPNGLTINKLTGIVGGTPAPGSNNTYSIMFTATNSVNQVTQGYTIAVSAPAPPPTFTLTVTELGTGTGQVTYGPPPQFTCSEANGFPETGTCSATYASGTPVTLTATPTSPSTFATWGGACASFTTNPTCNLTITSSENVTANFIPPPTPVALTFPVGTNPPPQEAVFNCPSNSNPCTDPSAHALQLTIPNVSATVAVTVLATEVPPSQANGLCGSTNSVLSDFDCRFVTFFSDGTDSNNNKIVPLCDPYANGNCVHYLVYSTSGGQGVEPPPSSYSGGVYWQITWNNESFVPPAPYWSGSTPQLYDDPDYAPTPTSSVGTNCSQPMTINGVNQSYSCQFEFNITEFYNPTQKVDSGIGGSTKQFNDVVVAFPPTVAGTGTVVQPPPTQSAPAITTTCLTGCSITGTTINFTIGSGGTFQALPTGYPAPTLTESGTLPSGLTINMLTGIVGGTPAPGSSGSVTISFTATNSTGHVTQSYTLTVSDAGQTITFPASPASAVYNTTFAAAATSSSGLPVTIAATGGCSIMGSTVTMTSGTVICVLTASQAGNGSFGPAPNVVHNVAAALATQSITFPASPASAVYNTTFTATATSSSGLTVTIAATGSCSISSGTVTMTSGTGTCTLTASQMGNSNFGPATSVVHNVAAATAAQTITFPASPLTAVYNTTFTATATSSSGLTVTIAATGVCTISSGTVIMTSGTGTCVLTASQAGNGNFGAATSVVHNVAATLAAQTITFTGAPASAAFGSSFTVAASASSGLAVTVTSSGACTNSGAVVTITAGSGTCSLIASQSGNTNYSAAASKNQSTTATKAGSTTTITSNTPNPSTVNQAVTISFKVTGSGTPTGTVSVTASTGGSCSGTLSSGAGSCTITFTSPASPTLTAAYAGDGNFNGSTSTGVSQTVNAISSTLKISPTSLNFGTVYLDQIGVQFVTLTNTGTAPITISSIKITTPGNAIADFGEITVCLPFIPSMPGTLQPGKTCTIAVGFLDASKIFSPTASTATIAITDNAAGSPQLIPLSLTVINPQASLSSTNLSFATQKVGTTSAAKTVTLTNTGNTPLTLGTLTVSGNFALVSGSGTTCSNNGTVAAGASCSINVTFKPTAKGNNTGSVKITDNARSSPQSISLSGTGN